MLSRRSHRWTGALLLIGASLALSGDALAQQERAYTIQGRVVDAVTGGPLSGVSVLIQGADEGALTDETGEYRLAASVAEGTYTLEFRLIGRRAATRDVRLGAGQTVQVDPVELEETAVALDEIVVTATGVEAERRALGNAVESVVGEAVSEAPAVTAIDQALQGKITGAVITQNNGQPGGGMSIRLRGTSSILGGAEPLIVIDGVIVDNNSGALVGMGANAGYSGSAMSNRLADLNPSDVERIEVLKGAAAAALYGSKANNGVIQVFTKQGSAGEPRITFRSEVSASETPARYDMLMVPEAGPGDVIFGPASEVGEPIERYDYQDRIWQTGWGTTSNLSISGGSGETTYYLSGTWTDDDGIMRGSGYARTGARAKLTQRLSDWLGLTVNANYMQTETNFRPEGEQIEGVLTTLIFTPPSWDPSYDPNQGRYPYSPIIGTNPLDVIENWEAASNVDRFVGSVRANATPTADLSFSYLFGVDDSREQFTYLQPPFSTSASFSGQIQSPVRSIRKINNDITANHELDVGPALQLTTTAGFRHTYDRTSSIRAAATGLNPGQTTIGSGGATPSASQGISEIVTVGGFLQERFTVGDRLFVTGGLNVEASSAFGEDERWQLFPRIGGSYLLDQEAFWPGDGVGGVLSTLRLRAAYGETGGQPPGAYIRFDNYGNTAHAGNPGLVPGSVAGNADLKPERQQEWEAGFDAGFFDDRASLEFTYYDQTTKDLVLGVPLHLSSGYSTQYQNVGEVANRGVELSLGTVNVDRPSFTWRSRLTYSANRNEVQQIYAGVDTLTGFGYMSAVIKGQPIGAFYATYYDRNADGSIALVDGKPQRARDEGGEVLRRIIGDPNPDFTGSLSNTLEVGSNVQLSFLLDGRFGNEVANFSRRIMDYFGASPAIEKEITGEVAEGYHFLNLERHLLYEAFVEDGTYVKLRELALDYTFDPSWVQRVGARSVALRVAGRNLHTWTDYSGLDPEINMFSANTVARGMDFATTPVPRSVVFGVTVDF